MKILNKEKVVIIKNNLTNKMKTKHKFHVYDTCEGLVLLSKEVVRKRRYVNLILFLNHPQFYYGEGVVSPE